MHKFILIIISFSFFSCINTSQNNINDSSIIHKPNTTEKSSESNFENHKKDDFFDESSSEKTNDSDEIIKDVKKTFPMINLIVRPKYLRGDLISMNKIIEYDHAILFSPLN